jgi:hypothetical protein
MGCNDGVSWCKQLREYRQRPHARGSDHGAGAAFEFGQCLTKGVARGIARACVIILPRLVKSGERVVRRQVQGRYNSAVLGIGFYSRTYSLGCFALLAEKVMVGLRVSVPSRSHRNPAKPAREGLYCPSPPGCCSYPHLSMLNGIAGVGTFSEWLVPLVAPASSGLSLDRSR